MMGFGLGWGSVFDVNRSNFSGVKVIMQIKRFELIHDIQYSQDDVTKHTYETRTMG